MDQHVSRRAFLVGTVGIGAAGVAGAHAALGDEKQDRAAQNPGGATAAGAGADKAGADAASIEPDYFPQQERSVVQEVVGVSHFNIDRVKELVEERPSLANAAWDWGFGDWETPLGAASHVGRREIAEYLISKGARVDQFAAAMLGKLDVVKAMMASTPGLHRMRGPHGITLMSHALAGGKEAESVVAYLETLEGADDASTVALPDEAARRRYLGTYSFGRGDEDHVEIAVDAKGQMVLKRGAGSGRRLFVVGKDEFHPAGAMAVRIRFEGAGKQAVRVVILDGKRERVGRRTG